MTADTTIREVRTALLRMPWPDDPWLAHHPLGPTRDLVLVEVVTQSGITGIGYLHLPLGAERQVSETALPRRGHRRHRLSAPKTDVGDGLSGRTIG